MERRREDGLGWRVRHPDAHPGAMAVPDPNSWIIRPAVAEDALWAGELFSRHLTELGLTHQPELDWDMVDFPGAYLEPHGYFCVAVDARQRGLGMGGILEATIRRVHVVPWARRLGLGRGILAHLCGWARNHRLPLVRAVIARGNLSSQRLFSAGGFSRTSHGCPPFGFASCDMWELRLEP
jgi:hypothetical protein